MSEARSDAERDPIARIEREEFARGHIGPGEEPVEPRPAATIVLARDASPGFEALLLRRPETSRFAAGAYVFPGGVIDEADADPSLLGRLRPEHAEGEPAALIAALRELFEETGLLLSDRSRPPEVLRRAREALLADETDFAAVAGELDLTFRELDAVYFARWITPEQLTRRYDTRFFLARHQGVEPSLTREHTGALWVRPAEASAGFREGRLPMLFPTWKTLGVLARFADLDGALEALSDRTVRPILARLEVRDGKVVPSMPGDPLYDEGA